MRGERVVVEYTEIYFKMPGEEPPSTPWSELRVLTRFNPIGLFQRDAALLLHSRGVRNTGTALHNEGRLGCF